jgi:hypothetical protein
VLASHDRNSVAGRISTQRLLGASVLQPLVSLPTCFLRATSKKESLIPNQDLQGLKESDESGNSYSLPRTRDAPLICWLVFPVE